MNLHRERQRAAGQHRACGLFGGGNSSSSQTTNNVDRKVVGRDGAQVSGDGNTVNVSLTDYGAVMRGTELSKAALAANAATFDEALGGLERAYAKGQAGDQEKLSMVGMAIVGLAGVLVLPKIFKKG